VQQVGFIYKVIERCTVNRIQNLEYEVRCITNLTLFRVESQYK